MIPQPQVYLRGLTGKPVLIKSYHEKAQKQISLWTLPFHILLVCYALRLEEHHNSRSRLGQGIEELCDAFQNFETASKYSF